MTESRSCKPALQAAASGNPVSSPDTPAPGRAEPFRFQFDLRTIDQTICPQGITTGLSEIASRQRASLLDRLRPVKGTDEYLRRNLPEERFRQIEGQYKRAGDAARGLFNYLNIADALRLAIKEGSLRLEEHFIRDMKRMRHGAAHVLEDLIAEYGDVKKLANVRRAVCSG